MSYILSIYFDREKVTSTENFFNNEEEIIPQGINDMMNNDNSLTFDSEKINQNRMINDQNNVNFDNTPESFLNNMEEEHTREKFSDCMEGESTREKFLNDMEEEHTPESFSNGMSEEYHPESFSNGMKKEYYSETNKYKIKDPKKTIAGIPESFLNDMNSEQFKSFKAEHQNNKIIESMNNKNEKNVMNNKNEKNIMNNTLSKTECLQNYNPRFERIGDICSPVATFENEFNAQGLNYPIGYNIK
jgi:hypothetical protein